MLDRDERVINELASAKANNRLMHVYLFYGGDSKTMSDVAKIFAATLYDDKLENNDAKLILEDKHLNIKSINIASDKTMITKEQISELEEEFSLTSLIEGPRVYIINGIDTASQAAQNSLLKFIEEPTMQDEVYGILIAYNLSNVLTTIKSRCGLIRFMPKSFRQVKDELSKEMTIDDAFMLASIANNINLCRELINNQEYLIAKEMVLNFININDAKEGVLFYLKYISINKNILKYFLRVLINIYHESLTLTKLISSLIYDKITLLKQNNSKEFLENKLTLLLSLENKIRYNVIEKNILHELIVSFF